MITAMQAPASWYDDPWHTAVWRWFDGRQWTPYTSTDALRPDVAHMVHQARSTKMGPSTRGIWIAIGIAAVWILGNAIFWGWI